MHRQENSVVKERIPKDYRLAVLDEKLRKTRTRHEARILEKLQELNFPAPRLQNVDDKQMRITMNFLDGLQVKEILHQNPASLSKEIGRKVGILHANNIIHADLTTSNMIHSKEIHFIDFGLSFVSSKAEDKAVDLHLLDRALESKHHDIYSTCITAAIEGYKEGNPDWQPVLTRLEKVKTRGRNKKK